MFHGFKEYIFLLVERSEDGTLLPDIECVACSPGTQPSQDKSVCLRCHVYPILKNHEGDERKERIEQCGSGSSCLSGPKGMPGVIEGGICIPTNVEIATNYQVMYQTCLES